jgi:integrase
MKLSVLAVENWKPAKGRQEILDRDGLYFIVQPSGVKSWALRYRRKSDGASVKHTLGSYPAITLKAARAMATELRAEIERGADPHGAKVVARRRAVEVDDAFEAVARRYIADLQFRKRRSWEWSARILGFAAEDGGLVVIRDGSTDQRGRRRVSLVDRWGARRIADIKDADIIDALDQISRHAPILGNRVHAVLSAFYGWAKAKRLVVSNPCTDLERPAEEHSRDRVLSDQELHKVWLASGELGHPFTGIVRLLILTGQRRNEIAGLRWSEIDEDVIHLPKERTKNNRPHDVPLSDQAQAIITELPPLVDFDPVFTIKRKPITGFSRMKEKLDAASGVASWTIHDVRRTVATGLQRLGIRQEVTEAVLNHKSGKITGVAAVYARHDYADEKCDALQRWADHVDALVQSASGRSGKRGKVVRLRA